MYKFVKTTLYENDLKRVVFNFVKACQRYNMKVAEDKKNSATIFCKPLKCKLVINDKVIEQVMLCKYIV